MPDLMNYACGLAEDIGPRPANSEEEHQAALKIADWFGERNIPVDVEEFRCPTWTSWPSLVSYVLVILAGVLAGLTSHRIIMLVLVLIGLALFVYERYFGGELGDRVRNGVSQNVVARYVPESIAKEKRRRKVIIVAHYDTERTSLEASPSLITSYPSLQKILLICMILIPVLIVVQMVVPDVARKWVWLFSCFVLLGPLMASINLLCHRFVLAFNDGANNNASGVAAMMGVFDAIVPGDLSPRARGDRHPTVHDEEAARREGLVAAGTNISYEPSSNRQPEPTDERRPSRVSSPKPRSAGEGQDSRRPSREGEREIDASAMLADVKEAAGYEEPVLSANRPETAIAEEPDREEVPTPSGVRKTAGTGTVMPKKQSAADRMAARREVQPVRPSADVPDWWKRVEGNRKKEAAPTSGESIKGRSQYADVPTTAYRRPEAETVVEEPTPEVMQEAALEIPVAKDALSALEQLVDRQQAHEGESLTERDQYADDERGLFDDSEHQIERESFDNREPQRERESFDDAEPQRGREPFESDERYVEHGQFFVDERAAEFAERPAPQETMPFTPIAPAVNGGDTQERPSRAAEPEETVPGLDSRLMDLPVVETRPSGKTTPGKLVSLINDDTFGARQVAPVSGEYRATPQNPDFAEGARGNHRPGDTGSITTGSGELFRAGTFAAGETGAFIPVSDPQLNGTLRNDMIIDDADDSSIGTVPTVGDFNAPASIDIPESRTHRLMDNVSDFFSHGKKKQQQKENSASDWLGVEDDYNPTKAGRDIGSWDNFNDKDDSGWKGGAAGYAGDEAQDTQAFELRQEVEERARESFIDKEVWFVALGAHGAGNAGMKSFIQQHGRDLNASLFINIDCVGAGEICYLDKEGLGQTYQSDQRLQAMARKTARELGGNIEVESLRWAPTDATPALRAGLRAITFMGFDRVAPVAWNQKGDDCSVLEPSRLDFTADVITEIVQIS